MIKTINILILFLCLSIPGNARVWKLSDKNLEIRFDDQTAILKVKDKRCHKQWEQSAHTEKYKVTDVSHDANTLVVSFLLPWKFTARYTLNENSALEIGLEADPEMPWVEFEFPTAFTTPDKDHYLLNTDGEGLLLPADDKEYPLGNGISYFCGGGLSMAWMGMTDTQFETGYMAILNTPYDAALRTKRENGLITFSPVWLASKEHFSYKRQVTYHFFNEGGYVAQAKTYRDYIWKKNRVITLLEQQKQFPAIEKMLGAVHIYVWDTGREVSFARELKQSGIDRAFIIWDANHYPYPVEGYDSVLKELGYANGGYDVFTDIYPRDTVVQPPSRWDDILWLRRANYPGKFNELVSRKKNGTTYFNEFGHYCCPEAVRPEMISRVTKEMAVYPHDAYLVDVYQANGLYECYAEEHPLTREAYAEAIIKNFRVLNDQFHVFVGSEWGADFAGSATVFAHGMMTLQRTWFGSEIKDKGTIYYYGDWKNNPRPSIMLSSRTAPDVYLKYSINEYTRIPLYELVYHDAMVTSWRWEDGNHHYPELWWKKDLFNILYGTPPLWSIDRNLWERYKNTFISSYRNVCPWLEEIAYDEMVSHRFISEDHKVQESMFSSGKSVIVNFGDREYVYGEYTIGPKAYRIVPVCPDPSSKASE